MMAVAMTMTMMTIPPMTLAVNTIIVVSVQQ